MKSLKELFRIGKGPSSSHTMGPQKAAQMFIEKYPNAKSFEVTLYGSLAATGKGHMTDVAIEDVLNTGCTRNYCLEAQCFLAFSPQWHEFRGNRRKW